jgi:hypothetical protein
MNFPRNWEFGSASSKLQNFGGGGVFKRPKSPSRYATVGSEFRDLCMKFKVIVNWTIMI